MINHLTLIIKGNKSDAATQAAGRGILFTFEREWRINGGYETVGRVPLEFETAVALWFCECPSRAPFPQGTLLYYSKGAQ